MQDAWQFHFGDFFGDQNQKIGENSVKVGANSARG